MNFYILTLFPDLINGALNYSITKKAQVKKLIKVKTVNIRDFSTDHYHTVDDKPYGGGPGMIMKIDIVVKALESLKLKSKKNTRIVLLDPRGKRYNQNHTEKLAKYENLIIICGHYEGIDERINYFIDEKISLGDFIITGGELASLVLIDSITRLLPGVIKKDSVKTETRAPKYLEYPQYTRPETFRKHKVPSVLLSGNHQKIEKWKTGAGR